MDWDDLKFLRAVGQAGSVSAAARTLAVDKATVSRRIAALEHALGQRMVERRSSGWRFTVAGARLAALAERIDVDLASLVADLAGQGALRAKVRLSAPHFFCNAVLLPHLRELRAKAPWIDLDINPSSRVLNLAEREAEVALRNLRPPRGDYVVRRAGELGSTLYGARRFVASVGALTGPDDLAGVAVVGFPDRLSHLPEFQWLDAMQDRLGPVLRLDDAESIGHAVAGEMGVAVLPCIVGDRYPGLMRLFAPVVQQTIWLVTPADMGHTRPVPLVVDFVARVFKRNAAALAGTGITGFQP